MGKFSILPNNSSISLSGIDVTQINANDYPDIPQDIIIDSILDNDGDPSTNGFTQETLGGYWSSTENLSNDAWFYVFNVGYSLTTGKADPYRVRAIRSF